MDPNSSLGRIFLGDDVIVILSDKAKGLGDWDSPEYQHTNVSKGKKIMNALSFYRMETDEISEGYIAKCFVNGLEAFDGEINLAFDENLISNKSAVKPCLDYEIIPETIYPEPDPFEDDSEKTGKSSDDWDQLLDFNFDDVPKSGEELPSFVCKMGKSNRNKKRAMENFNLFYQDVGPSSPVIETMAYNEKYKKILDEIWKDKVELDGKTVKEDEEAVKRIKGEALKEGKVNENAIADTGSDINTMPY
ncbi:hypothetical protein Tco_0970030 [Tanacetum coccineum]